jgi:outer membrane protein OmpA-like peptidoglycan-associated protein
MKSATRDLLQAAQRQGASAVPRAQPLAPQRAELLAREQASTGAAVAGGGGDFSRVRVHTRGPLAEAAHELGARGLACGDTVALAPAQPAAAPVLAHELTHVAQQQASGVPALQFDPDSARAAQAGIGASPPSEPFINDDGGVGAEDGHVLYDNDQALPPLGDAQLRALVPQAFDSAQPMVVHLHGYASTEGAGEYNLNLSAHRTVELRRRLLALLPPDSRVHVFAHGRSTHFGASERNRRVGISVIGPVELPAWQRRALQNHALLGAGLQQPSFEPGAAATPPIGLPPGSTTVGPTITPPPWLTLLPPGAPATPRHLMDNAAMLLPLGMHGVGSTALGSTVEHWDSAYLKYHQLGLPDQLKLGPIDLGAAALAGREVSANINANLKRNSPTPIEQSNDEVGAKFLMSPNLLELGKKPRKKKKEEAR